eukprot:scaffold13528_cov126-Isochrysis_galbana.AAC.1
MHRRVAMSALGRRRLSSPATLRTLPRIDPRAAISDADIDQLNEEGAIVLRGILAPEWIEVLREAAEANLSNPGPLCDEHSAAQGTAGRFHDDQFLWRRHPEFAEYVLRSGAGALAARAMRSSTAHIFYDQLFVKEPGTTAPTPWHNDTSYWHMEGQQICSIWLALDDVRCCPLNVGDEVVGSRCKGWVGGQTQPTACTAYRARFLARPPPPRATPPPANVPSRPPPPPSPPFPAPVTLSSASSGPLPFRCPPRAAYRTSRARTSTPCGTRSPTSPATPIRESTHIVQGLRASTRFRMSR